jgi:hypothetical protein
MFNAQADISARSSSSVSLRAMDGWYCSARSTEDVETIDESHGVAMQEDDRDGVDNLGRALCGNFGVCTLF